jgi:hypothetical protein
MVYHSKLSHFSAKKNDAKVEKNPQRCGFFYFYFPKNSL